MASNLAYIIFDGLKYVLEYKNELHNLDANTISQAKKEANTYLRLNYGDHINIIVEYTNIDQL